MGGIEFTLDANGQPRFLCIDKGGEKVNVGSKLEDFQVVRPLGKGHFGAVYLVTSKLTNKLYAMKEIQTSKYKSQEEVNQVEKEIKLLENLRHPHVITYFNSFKQNGNIYIVIEYINGGSLEELLLDNIKKQKRIDEKTLWDLLIQSLSGLLYLHEKRKIIHRDIKPDNLLLDSEGHLKISDFGVSAIKSDEVDDLLKCHGTVAGPIQFMAPEMCLGDAYDFKSDIYMLGLTFWFMASNNLPERKLSLGPLIIPIKNPNAKLPDCYSEMLKGFINSLLKPPEERPSTSEAYYQAISFYSIKYLQTTSICSTLLCFNSIVPINQYFGGDKVKNFILSDEANNTENYIITKYVKEAIDATSPFNFNYQNARLECLKLRLTIYADKDRMESSTEVDLNNFVSQLLPLLHKELNKFKGTSPQIGKADESNEIDVINKKAQQFMAEYRSKISDQFYYLTKMVENCDKCKKIIKYYCIINSLCAMYPDKTAEYVKKKNITVLDLFKHYHKTRSFTTKTFCRFCNKNIENISRTKIFYTSPFNFILEICYDDESKFNLKIDQNINISDFVERKDFCKVNYTLVGAIFIEKDNNDNEKYVSVSKIPNGGWVYFNGNSVQNCGFDTLQNHKNLQMLFYSSN
jgi:serine/threonine protein kinase